MIVSASTARALFLATLAVHGSSSSSNSALRGKTPPEDNDSRRDLLIMDMNMGLGEMVCKEHPDDGSVVCSVRTMAPTNMVTGHIHHDCLYSSTEGSNFCLQAEIFQIPEPPFASGIANKPASNIPPPVVANNPDGKCPSYPPATGMACQRYVPLGQSTTTCTFGSLMCSCDLLSSRNGTPVVWSCANPDAIQEIVVAKPPPVQVIASSNNESGKCPLVPQATGMACARFVPPGEAGISCKFGTQECRCNLSSNPSIVESWSCFTPVNNANLVSENIEITVSEPVVPSNPVTSTTQQTGSAASTSSYSEWQCRPLGTGCSAPHTLPSTCDGIAACCPGSIIANWSTGKNTCKHN